MRHTSRTTRSLLALLCVALGAPAAYAGTGPDLQCATALPSLPGGPAGAVAPIDPVRTDPDGFTTLTSLVEDPVDVAEAYLYAPDLPGATSGTFRHVWPQDPSIATTGRYHDDGTRRVRVPVLLIESTEELGRMLEVLAQAQFGTVVNLEPLLLELLTPGTQPFEYPESLDWYIDAAPTFVWTIARAGIWSGFVHTQQGTSRETDATGKRIVEACRREHISTVVRTGGTTSAAAGVFIDDHVTGSVVDGRFTAIQQITAGASAVGVDVPITTLRADHESLGGERRSDLTVGATVDGAYQPLLGVRSHIVRAAFPEAENRMISLGVFGRNDDFHPQVGARYHFEDPPQDWNDGLVTAGLGAHIGDMEADTGAFDVYGAFIPQAGATYDDSLDQVGRDTPTGLTARAEFQAMITAGVWRADGVTFDGQRPSPVLRYTPLAGATYDGDLPLLAWERAWLDDSLGETGAWLATAGAFGPSGYVPAAGIQHTHARADGATIERVRAGTFAASYDAFVPVTEARWSSDRTAGAWADGYGTDLRAPSDARLDVGAVAPGDTFVPVLGVTAEAGEVEHYGIGAWAAGGFVELLAACRGPGPTAGVRAGGENILWAGRRNGDVTADTFNDCPA